MTVKVPVSVSKAGSVTMVLTISPCWGQHWRRDAQFVITGAMAVPGRATVLAHTAQVLPL